MPVNIALHQAGRHDLYACGEIPYILAKGSTLVADRGYDANWFREKLKTKGIQSRIRQRMFNKVILNPISTHGRWVVVRTFAWMEKFRKLSVRYEYKLTNYKGFWTLACCSLLLKELTE